MWKFEGNDMFMDIGEGGEEGSVEDDVWMWVKSGRRMCGSVAHCCSKLSVQEGTERRCFAWCHSSRTVLACSTCPPC